MAIFTITYTPSALDDIMYYRKYERQIILDGIDTQLSDEPLLVSRNRKPLTVNQLGEWEIRISKYRVFYHVDTPARTVEIRAVGHKEHNTLYVRGKAYLL